MITKEQAMEILDKFDFFQGQRASRELWSEKPFAVQEEDIANFARDVAFLKEYIEAVNVSEVVRCKDCKFWTPMDNGISWHHQGRTDGECEKLWQLHCAERHLTNQDHFAVTEKGRNEMARYIEKEPLCAWLENMGVSDFIIRKIESEANFPTADVVPKREADMLHHLLKDAWKRIEELSDLCGELQKAEAEVENLKVLLEIKDVSYAGLKELYDTDTTALIKAREKTEVEVAREILEEIESVMFDRFSNIMLGEDIRLCIAELKKKYT